MVSKKTSLEFLKRINQLPWNESLWLVTQILQEMIQEESPAVPRQPLRSLLGLW